nr:hypothetical protein BaRGS_028604 [Batillaria attramentaria]
MEKKKMERGTGTGMPNNFHGVMMMMMMNLYYLSTPMLEPKAEDITRVDHVRSSDTAYDQSALNEKITNAGNSRKPFFHTD